MVKTRLTSPTTEAPNNRRSAQRQDEAPRKDGQQDADDLQSARQSERAELAHAPRHEIKQDAGGRGAETDGQEDERAAPRDARQTVDDRDDERRADDIADPGAEIGRHEDREEDRARRIVRHRAPGARHRTAVGSRHPRQRGNEENEAHAGKGPPLFAPIEAHIDSWPSRRRQLLRCRGRGR